MQGLFYIQGMKFLNLYNTYPIEVQDADGIYLIDKNGKKYLDAVSGLGVNLLGYNHPKINKILSEKNPILHLSSLYLSDIKEEVAEILCERTGMDNVFFSNSGTESVEGAIKFAWKTNPGKIIAFTNSFHGRTSGALSLSHKFIQQRFPRIDVKIEFLPWDNPEVLGNADANIIIFEPVQGAGGVIPASQKFFDILKEKQEKGTILIADEIQSGLGRTGKFLAVENWHIKPDIIVLAKGLGGGIPLGAILMNKGIAENISTGDHGTTMGGNILALKLAKVVLKEVQRLLPHINELSQYIDEKFIPKFEDKGIFVRKKGLFIGFDVDDAVKLKNQTFQDKVIVNTPGKKTIRLLTPLIIKKNEVDNLFNTILRHI